LHTCAPRLGTVLDNDSVAGGRTLPAVGVLKGRGPSLARWYRVLAVPRLNAGDRCACHRTGESVIRARLQSRDLRVPLWHRASEHPRDRAEYSGLRVESDPGVEALEERFEPGCVAEHVTLIQRAADV